MPYRLNPDDRRCVQVQKSGKWQNLKCHDGHNALSMARRHLAALKINVEGKGGHGK